MINNDINLRIFGLDDAKSDTLAEDFIRTLGQFANLNLQRLKEVIITSEFEKEIAKRTPYNNNRVLKDDTSLAKVLTLPSKEGFEMVMVLRLSLIKTLLSKDTQSLNYADALHVLHHELCHVHDNNNKIDQFEDIMKKERYKGKNAFIYPIAEACWSEYIANVLSSSSAKNSLMPQNYATALELSIREKEHTIQTEVMVFKSNKNRTDVLDSVKGEIESLLKSASYVLGYMHGMGKSLEEISYDTNYLVETSYFKDIWEVLAYELRSMLEVYPYGWVNLNIYRNLAFAIEAFFNQMGVVLMEDEKKELYFKVM